MSWWDSQKTKHKAFLKRQSGEVALGSVGLGGQNRGALGAWWQGQGGGALDDLGMSKAVFNIAQKLAKARRDGNQATIEMLELAKNISSEHEKQHKLLTSQATLFGQPLKSLDTMIKQIPIIGDLLSAELGLEDMANELKIMAIVSESVEVTNTIENPTLSRQQLVDTLINLFEDSITDTSKRLLSILAENKRLNLLQPIYSIYQELLENHKEQNSIEVFVATAPSDEAREGIEKKLRSSYGNDANIYFSEDPKLMGGLSIKVGDETLDLSIRGKVNKLVNQLNF